MGQWKSAGPLLKYLIFAGGRPRDNHHAYDCASFGRGHHEIYREDCLIMDFSSMVVNAIDKNQKALSHQLERDPMKL